MCSIVSVHVVYTTQGHSMCHPSALLLCCVVPACLFCISRAVFWTIAVCLLPSMWHAVFVQYHSISCDYSNYSINLIDSLELNSCLECTWTVFSATLTNVASVCVGGGGDVIIQIKRVGVICLLSHSHTSPFPPMLSMRWQCDYLTSMLCLLGFM